MRNAGNAADRRREHKRAAEQDEVRSKSKGFQDIRSAPDAAINDDLQTALRSRDLRQHVEGSDEMVELASAVRRQYYRIDPAGPRPLNIRRRDEPFDDEVARPAAPDCLEIRPA